MIFVTIKYKAAYVNGKVAATPLWKKKTICGCRKEGWSSGRRCTEEEQMIICVKWSEVTPFPQPQGWGLGGGTGAAAVQGAEGRAASFNWGVTERGVLGAGNPEWPRPKSPKKFKYQMTLFIWSKKIQSFILLICLLVLGLCFVHLVLFHYGSYRECVCVWFLHAHAQYLEKNLMCSADTGFPLLHSLCIRSNQWYASILPFILS